MGMTGMMTRLLFILAAIGTVMQTPAYGEEKNSSWWPFPEVADQGEPVEAKGNPDADVEAGLKEIAARLERLRGLRDKAEFLSDDAERLCHLALDRVSFVEREVSALKEALIAARYRLRRMAGQVDLLESDLGDQEDDEASLEEELSRLNALRDQALVFGREICDETEKVIAAGSYEERQQ